MDDKTGVPGRNRVMRRMSVLLIAGVVFAGGCEGDNLFSGDTTGGVPQVDRLSLPQVAYAGDVMTVRVDASGARGITQVVLALRGAVSRDTIVKLPVPRARISEVVNVNVPQVLTDTLILVQAKIIDQNGSVSPSSEGTVVVFGPPAIISVSTPATVELGELMSVRVTAYGARNISRIDLLARGAIQLDSTIAVSPPRTQVTQDIVFRLPSTASDTLVSLSVFASDALGQSSAGSDHTVPIVIEPPQVELTAPTTANAGLDLLVSVHAASVRGVSQVRLELRGAYVKDLTIPISPTESDVVKNISVPLPGNILTNDLRVRAAAVDKGGDVAYSSEEIVYIPLGAPVVTSLEVPSGANAGKTVDIRVRATGDRPITKLEVKFRGAVDNTQMLTISPLRTDVIQDAFVSVPSSVTDSILTVSATAIDISGAVSEIVSQSIPILTTAPAPTPVPEPAAMAPLSFLGVPAVQSADRTLFGLQPAWRPVDSPVAWTSADLP